MVPAFRIIFELNCPFPILQYSALLGLSTLALSPAPAPACSNHNSIRKQMLLFEIETA